MAKLSREERDVAALSYQSYSLVRLLKAFRDGKYMALARDEIKRRARKAGLSFVRFIYEELYSRLESNEAAVVYASPPKKKAAAKHEDWPFPDWAAINAGDICVGAEAQQYLDSKWNRRGPKTRNRPDSVTEFLERMVVERPFVPTMHKGRLYYLNRIRDDYLPQWRKYAPR